MLVVLTGNVCRAETSHKLLERLARPPLCMLHLGPETIVQPDLELSRGKGVDKGFVPKRADPSPPLSGPPHSNLQFAVTG